jgi:hypothetical protein
MPVYYMDTLSLALRSDWCYYCSCLKLFGITVHASMIFHSGSSVTNLSLLILSLSKNYPGIFSKAVLLLPLVNIHRLTHLTLQ